MSRRPRPLPPPPPPTPHLCDVMGRAELAACEGHRAALGAVCLALQTEMLQLYAQTQADGR